jgi:WD40 repeat protein
LRTDRIDFPDPIRDWTFANEGRSIVIADEQGKVRRWSGHRYQTETEIFSMPSQHTFGRNRVFSEDGRHLAMTNTSGDCLLVDLEQPRQRKHFPNRGGPAADNAFFIGNQWLVLPRAPDETIAIADIESGRIVLQSPALPGVTTGIYNSGQGYFAQIAFNQNLRLNHLDDSPIKDLKLRYHEAGWAASFSPDGRLLAIPSFLGYVRIWDTHTWEEVRTIDSFLLGVNSAGFSPDGRRMLVGGEVLKEEALRLFDTTNWLDVLTLDREGTHFSRTLFSPDGNAVGTEDTKGQLTIWTAPTWEAIATEESRTGAWLGHSSH